MLMFSADSFTTAGSTAFMLWWIFAATTFVKLIAGVRSPSSRRSAYPAASTSRGRQNFPLS